MDNIRDALSSARIGITGRPFNFAANLASLAGLALAIFGLSGASGENAPGIILASYLVLVATYLLWRYLRQERWARYAEGIAVMDRALRRLKETTDRRIYLDSTEADFYQGLQEALAAFAEAFTLVTGTNCRATLKEVFQEEVASTRARQETVTITQDLMVATWARSDIDEHRREENAHERVDANSDFYSAFTNVAPWFGDNLPRRWAKKEYENSHWTESLRKSRKFPYRSAIVWPVEAYRPEGRGDDAAQSLPVIGLLCVDSKSPVAFRERADVPFGSQFAHSLYPVLRYELGE